MSDATAPPNPTTGVPVTAPVPTTGDGLGTPIIHSLYKEFYGDVSVYPLWSPDYAPLLGIMTILPANAITGPDICQGIRNNQNTQTFICMGLFEDPLDLASLGRIEVIHRLTYLSPPFGGVLDPSIHNKLYGIVGDLMTGRQVAKVVIPAEALNASEAIRIASDQVFQAATSSGSLPDSYGPFPNAGVDNSVTQTRPLCFITPHVAALILDSKARSPKSILELLGPVLDFDQYRSMFNWLRVAQTVRAGGRAITTQAQFASAPPREEVNKLIMTIVGQDLPMMGHAPIHQVGQQITNAVGQFTATFVAQSEADRLRRSETSQSKEMTVEKKFTFQAAPLRHLLQITDLSDAPDVWKVIAANNTKQVRQVLQTALNEKCFKLHLKPPILHQALTRIIVDPSLWRCADGPDNVLQGLSLFHVLLRSQSDERERMKAAASYDLAMSTGSSLTSQDTFYFNHPGHIDTTWVEPLVAKMTLKHMMALCATILGGRHTVTVGLQLALQHWEDFEMTLHNKYSCSPDTWTMEILYWFHRQLSHWIDIQYHADTPIPFDVEPLFNDILLGNRWSRGMPLEYVPARLIPSLATPSLISGLTPHSASPPGAPGAGRPRDAASEETRENVTVYQPADQKVAQLAAFAAQQNNRRLLAIIATAVTAGHQFPTDASSQQFCLTYHILGRCNQSCRRIRNHRLLTDSEVATLAAWCTLAF
jgi:hypothetical protein